MSIIIDNIKRINKRDLKLINNQKLRIIDREKKIKYLESIFKSPPITFNDMAKTSNDFNIIHHNKVISKNNENKQLNLPRINTNPNKSINSYERMKNYKVYFNKKKGGLSENKVKTFLIKSGFSFNPVKKDKISNKKEKNEKKENAKIDINSNIEEKKDKEGKEIINDKVKLSKKDIRIIQLKNDIKQNFIEEKQNTNRSSIDSEDTINKKKKKYKKIDFEHYLKMQIKAEIALKPKLGDNSNDLIEYINAIKDIRHNLIDNFVSEINNAENRFNKEKPEVDSEFDIADKSLYAHKWKNLFFLKDYQRFFSKGLKGKISNNNYYIMQKKFLEINEICFAEPKGQAIKTIERTKEKEKEEK